MSFNPHTDKTRVVRTISDPRRWQAQYFDPSMGLWFDLGDSETTENLARVKIVNWENVR